VASGQRFARLHVARLMTAALSASLLRAAGHPRPAWLRLRRARRA